MRLSRFVTIADTRELHVPYNPVYPMFRLVRKMSLTEIEWETVEENLSMLSDATLERFHKKIFGILMQRRVTARISKEAFE